MRKSYKVSVAHFRPGAVIEFTPFGPSRATQGTVKHLISLGARHIVAVLSRKVESDGKVITEENKEYHAPLLFDIRHASRVIQHGVGDVQFLQEPKPALLAELAEVRASNAYARRGNRIVLTGGLTFYSPHAVLRMLVAEYMSKNSQTLGIQPWEYFDEFRFMESLQEVGIVKETVKSKYSIRLDVRTDKFDRYLRQNVNRFKENLDKLARQRQQDDIDALTYRDSDTEDSAECAAEEFEEASAF